MVETPYTSPPSVSPAHAGRASAIWSTIYCGLILSVGAVYNAYMFAEFDNPAPENVIAVLQIANIAGALFVVAVITFFTLPLLELLSSACCYLFAKSSSLDKWHGELYAVLSTTVPFAILGAIVWCSWVYAFYVLRMDFHQISVPTGMAAHVLAAFVYLRIVFRWWRLEHSPAPDA